MLGLLLHQKAEKVSPLKMIPFNEEEVKPKAKDVAKDEKGKANCLLKLLP